MGRDDSAHDPDSDIDGLEEYVTQWPQNPEFRFFLGLAYLEAERHSDALASFETAVALNPYFTFARIYVGVSMIALGWYERAIAELQAALTYEGCDRGKANYWLGMAYTRLHCRQEAADVLLESVRASPQSAAPHLLLADLSLDRAVTMPRPENFRTPRYDITLDFRTGGAAARCRVRLFDTLTGGTAALVSQHEKPLGVGLQIAAEEVYSSIIQMRLAGEDLEYFSHSFCQSLIGSQHLQRVTFTINRGAAYRARAALRSVISTEVPPPRPTDCSAAYSPCSHEEFEALTGFRLEWKVE